MENYLYKIKYFVVVVFLTAMFLLPVLPILIPFPIFQARWSKLSEMTGCMPLCTVRFLFTHYQSFSDHHRSFTFVEKTSEEANWARNWSSAFYLDVKTSSYIHQTEFYACKQILNCIPSTNLFSYFHTKYCTEVLINLKPKLL